MKRLECRMMFELTDESGSHSVGHNSLMGSYSTGWVVYITEDEFVEDSKKAVANAIKQQINCSTSEAKKIGEEIAEKIVSV